MAPEIIVLFNKYEDINIRQAEPNFIKFEIDMEAFGLRFCQTGLNRRQQKRHRKSRLKGLYEIMREEFIKIDRIKDPNAKVWKIRTSNLGDKHKAPEPACIQNPCYPGGNYP